MSNQPVLDVREYKFFEKIKSLPFVKKIILFGSRARKDNQSRSDIDLAILCPEATSSDWLEITNIIEDADTLLKIDCLRVDSLSNDSPVKKNILKDGVELYVKN